MKNNFNCRFSSISNLCINNDDYFNPNKSTECDTSCNKYGICEECICKGWIGDNHLCDDCELEDIQTKIPIYQINNGKIVVNFLDNKDIKIIEFKSEDFKHDFSGDISFNLNNLDDGKVFAEMIKNK